MVSKGGKEHAINTGRTSGARPRRAPSTTNLTRYHPIPCTHPTYSYLWLSPRLFLSFSRAYSDSLRVTVFELRSLSLHPISAHTTIDVLDSRSDRPFQKHPKADIVKFTGSIKRIRTSYLRTAASNAFTRRVFRVAQTRD